jgi:hypothetical protein
MLYVASSTGADCEKRTREMRQTENQEDIVEVIKKLAGQKEREAA